MIWVQAHFKFGSKDGNNIAMNHKQLEDYILSKPGARLDYPFGEDVAVYKVADKMFALISEQKTPLRVSLKCDPLLAETLREQYESVLPGYHLNKKHWNTILLTGQLSDEDIVGFIDLSYSLVVDGLAQEQRKQLTA